MSRDRYAQLKAERQRQQQEQQQYQQQQQPYEYENNGGPAYGQDYATSTTELAPGRMQSAGNEYYEYNDSNQYEMQGMNGGGGSSYPQQIPQTSGKSQNNFFEQIDLLSSSLHNLKRTIDQIGTLHTRILTVGADEQREYEAKQELDQTTKSMQKQMASIKQTFEMLSAWPPTSGGETEKNTRKLQVGSQKKKFMDMIQEYREVEARSREKYRDRMARQYKIVKPDASNEEVRQAVESDHGAQVFANALTESTRYGDARNAYKEVQQRHADIKKISETMVELQQLFNDMANLVEQQDHQIITIENTAQEIEKDMAQGEKEITKGVVSAKKARSKRKFCFWLLLIIVLVAAIAITIYVLKKNGTI